MRQEVFEPIRDKSRLEAVQALVRELYWLHETGREYSGPLAQLCELVGKSVKSRRGCHRDDS